VGHYQFLQGQYQFQWGQIAPTAPRLEKNPGVPMIKNKHPAFKPKFTFFFQNNGTLCMRNKETKLQRKTCKSVNHLKRDTM